MHLTVMGYFVIHYNLFLSGADPVVLRLLNQEAEVHLLDLIVPLEQPLVVAMGYGRS